MQTMIQDPAIKLFVLILLFLVHWFIILFFVFYYVVSRQLLSLANTRGLDIFYMVAAAGILLHWMVLKYECIISYMEKMVLYPGYYMGKDPLANPSLFLGFQTTMRNPFIQLSVFVMWGIIAINIAAILAEMFPSRSGTLVNGVAAAYITFIVGLMFVYYKIKDRSL